MAMTFCPKCRNTEIDVGWPLSAGKITYKSDKMRLFSLGGVCRAYVCKKCGYLESYVESDYLSRIKSQPQRS